MTLKYEPKGTNPDGSTHFEITSDSENPHFVITGKEALGNIELPDGTSYDVTPPVIEAETLDHAHQLQHAIGQMDTTPPHDCNELCDAYHAAVRKAGKKK